MQVNIPIYIYFEEQMFVYFKKVKKACNSLLPRGPTACTQVHFAK